MSCLHEDIFHFLAKAEPFSKEEILKGFKLFDYDGTGKISFEKLKLVASEVKEDITDEELQVCEAQAYFSCSGRECKGLLIGKLCFVSLQQTQSVMLTRSLAWDLYWCLGFMTLHPLRSHLIWSPKSSLSDRRWLMKQMWMEMGKWIQKSFCGFWHCLTCNYMIFFFSPIQL